MRILTYHPRARVGDGGITNSVRRLSEAFARAGAAPVILHDGHGAGWSEHGVEWRPLRHVGRGRGRVPVLGGRAVDDADVVVLNSAWTAANARIGRAARARGVPYVLAPRGAYDPLILHRRRGAKRLWWRLAEQRLVLGAAAVHVFFDDQRREVEALGYRGAFLVAPNGVRVPEGWRWDGGSGRYLLYLGRFDPEHKGLDLLLDALALLPSAERPTLRLHGSDWRGGKRAVEDRIRAAGLGEHAVVDDPVYGEDKWRVLARCEALVYPSRWEGFGNSLAEASALGVPTVATPYPLARFLAAQGGCLLVEAEAAAIAAGLRAIRDGRGRGIGEAGAQAVARHLDWDAVARRWLEQLRPLVTGQASLE